MLDKTFNPGTVEPKYRKIWAESGGSAAGKNPENANASNADYCSRAFTVMMPPPNVTGSLHIGHALTLTLQDALIRYNRMNGKDTLWQAGTDHAGIAVQSIIEKQLDREKTTRFEIGRGAFMSRAWKWKAESGGTIMKQLSHLGASPDWSRERFTMDEGLSNAVLKVFVELHDKGLIYKDTRLVNWDPKLKTAISDLEVEPKEINGKLWHFAYPVEGSDEVIVVATTRPETMLGDTAVAVHPSDVRYQHLAGKNVRLPLVDRLIPIISDEYPDPEAGTGAVKMTPAHDFNDFEVAKRHGLDFISIFDEEARINANAPEAYRGLSRYDARKKVVADFEALGLLKEVQDHIHKVPHGDRSKEPVEPRLTEQWYVDAATLAKPALEAVESGKTRFHPKQWENTYYAWLRDIRPWCISRQLWWGHQIPAWYGPDREIFVALDAASAQAKADAHYGKPTPLERDPDVLDTWFSSALWPFSTLGWPAEPGAGSGSGGKGGQGEGGQGKDSQGEDNKSDLEKYYPTSTLVTGHDIIFFWVARMMMMGIHFIKDVPFKDVYIHALVRDAQGVKMSKSIGNVIDPLETIEAYGCDALRFTLLALAVAGRDIKLSNSRVEGYRNFTTKLWNAARFAEMNEAAAPADFDPASVSLDLNAWIIGETAKALHATGTALNTYNFNEAADATYQFVWNRFCDWYIEFSKPVFYGDDPAAIRETRATMAWCLKQIVHMLHPLMPFLTEELWEKMLYRANGGREGGSPGGKLLMNSRWPDLSPSLIKADASAQMDWLIELVTAVRSARAELNVPAGAKIPMIAVTADPAQKARIEALQSLAMRQARLSEIGFAADVPKGAVQLVVAGVTFAMPLAGVVDFAAETERLNREVVKLEGEIAKLDKTLNNPDFIERAPKAVIGKQREDRSGFELKLEKTKEARRRLAELG